MPGALWIPLVAVAGAWNTAAFLGRLGEPHPTLRTVTAMAMTRTGVRPLVIIFWIALGWRLLRRRAWPARLGLGVIWLALGYHLFLDAPQVSP